MEYERGVRKGTVMTGSTEAEFEQAGLPPSEALEELLVWEL